MIQQFNQQHIHLLIDAFENDPMFVNLFKGLSKHHQMKAFFKFIYLRNHLMKGIYLTDSEEHLSYVAFIETPKNNHKYTLISKARLSVEMLKLAFYIPLKSLNLLSQYDRITSEQRPFENHYYLTMIGVSVEKKGQGIGKKVINKIHQIVISDVNTKMICLDTENKNNVTYYERLGYKLTNEVLTDHFSIYCMTWKQS